MSVVTEMHRTTGMAIPSLEQNISSSILMLLRDLSCICALLLS
jgi:hypothetical protein